MRFNFLFEQTLKNARKCTNFRNQKKNNIKTMQPCKYHKNLTVTPIFSPTNFYVVPTNHHLTKTIIILQQKKIIKNPKYYRTNKFQPRICVQVSRSLLIVYKNITTLICFFFCPKTTFQHTKSTATVHDVEKNPSNWNVRITFCEIQPVTSL